MLSHKSYSQDTRAPKRVIVENADLYLGVIGGLNYLQSDKDLALRSHPGFFGGLKAGYQLSFGLSLEGELIYRKDNYKKPHFLKEMHSQSWSPMLNVLFKLPIGFIFRPYIGVGAGYCKAKERYQFHSHSKSVSQAKNGIAWQGFLGLILPITTRIDCGIEYRYFVLEKYDRKNHDIGVFLRKFF